MMNLAESNLWDNVLRSIKTKLQGESFETWFDPIRFEGIDRERSFVRLRAPNQVVQDWVEGQLCKLDWSVFWRIQPAWLLRDLGVTGRQFQSSRSTDPASAGRRSTSTQS